MKFFITITLSILLTFQSTAFSDDKDKKEDPMKSGTFSGLKLRGIGPAITSAGLLILP